MFSALLKRHQWLRERDDFRAGVQAAAICNTLVAIHTKKGAKIVIRKPQDLFKFTELVIKEASGFAVSDGKQTWQEQLEMVKLLNVALGGKRVKKRKG